MKCAVCSRRIEQVVEKIIPKKKELAAMGDGCVVEEGKPELIFTAPKERRTQTFFCPWHHKMTFRIA